MQVRHRDIAEKLGVNVSTVSRALARHPHVRDSLAAEIRACAERMGYRPNPMVTALMSARRRRDTAGSKGTLAILHQEPEYGSHVWESRVEAVRERANQLGFHLNPIHVEAHQGKSLQRTLRARGIEGVILGRPLAPHMIPLVPWDSLASTALGFQQPELRTHTTLSHDLHTIRIALAAARDHGYRRAGLAIAMQTSELLDHAWVGGYAVEQALGNPCAVLPVCINPDGARPIFRKWFRRHRPDVIVSNHADLQRMLAEEEGVLVPRDVAWIHLGDFGAPSEEASIVHQHDKVAAAAVDLVTGQLFRNERGLPEVPVTVLVEPRFRPGTSLPFRA